MRTLLQNISEDLQAVVGRLNAVENSSTIPDDLVFEILLRLPAKSIARCRCLSKLCASVHNSQYFTDRYLKIASARPQLLFAVEKDGELLFFSSPHQPQNREEDGNTSHAAVNYHMSFPLTRDNDMYIPMAINGLVCARDKNKMAWVICNPSTGQSFTLPMIKTRIKTRYGYKVRYFFGYDPVNRKFRVLSIGWAHGAIYQDHQVLTLETGKLSWRMIECDVPQFPDYTSVCINGVLYYKANLFESSCDGKIMSFDVRSEKYSLIEVMKPFTALVRPETELVNYKGKLALLRPSKCYFLSRESTSFEMWVLDELEKKEWFPHVYKLPPIWENVAADNVLYCAGVTCSNEAMLVKYFLDGHFYVFYYSLETGTSRIVEIQGLEAFRKLRVYTFVDHVEDVKLLKGVLGL